MACLAFFSTIWTYLIIVTGSFQPPDTLEEKKFIQIQRQLGSNPGCLSSCTSEVFMANMAGAVQIQMLKDITSKHYITDKLRRLRISSSIKSLTPLNFNRLREKKIQCWQKEQWHRLRFALICQIRIRFAWPNLFCVLIRSLLASEQNIFCQLF